MQQSWYQIMRETKVIFIKFSLEGKILDVNDFTFKILGNKLIQEDLSKCFLDFSGQLNINSLLNTSTPTLLNTTTASGYPQSFLYRFFEVDGEFFCIGEFDQEEADLLKMEMMTMNNELSNLTRELHKKSSELEKLNEIKNQFIGVAAHDLRNPVGNIIRLSEFLLDELNGKLSETQLKFLNMIKSLGELGLNLLNDLLDLIKIESGKFDLNLKPVDGVEVLKKVIEFSVLTAQRKQIKIRFNNYENFPRILADSNSLYQILENLISNAIKFSPAGSLIEVGCIAAGNFLTFYVKDQGQGIPKKDFDKLFLAFSKTSVKSTAGEKSTGLGLTIVKKLVIGHGGKIWLDSEEGTGSVFYFSIPFAVETKNVDGQKSLD
jgi:signal transduction histidine kinase